MANWKQKPYETVAEKQERARLAIERLRKKNPDIAPVCVTGRALAKTWWGLSWNDNLEQYADYENRLGRGRSYVRQGAVIDLQIEKGLVTALVLGNRRTPYQVMLQIDPLPEALWQDMIKASCGYIESLADLLDGAFPTALAELFTETEKGLFPTPQEIHLPCSCPDQAHLCKHLVAVLYGIGARLDHDPGLFFILRGVAVSELISGALDEASDQLLKRAGQRSDRVLLDDAVTDLFDLDQPGT